MYSRYHRRESERLSLLSGHRDGAATQRLWGCYLAAALASLPSVSAASEEPTNSDRSDLKRVASGSALRDAEPRIHALKYATPNRGCGVPRRSSVERAAY